MNYRFNYNHPALPPRREKPEAMITERTFQDEWEKARYYLDWGIRHGMSKQTLLLIPQHPEISLSKAERRMIRALIIEHFKKLGQ